MKILTKEGKVGRAKAESKRGSRERNSEKEGDVGKDSEIDK